MSQTLTYVMGADNRALVDNVQDFHIDWNEQRNDNWITARQWEDGMRQVFVNIKNQDGTPFDLTGCNVWFEGFLPKSAKGDFRIIDDEGYVPIDESAGRFRFDMPKQAFPLAGSYRQAFFRILKNGNSVTTLEFDLKVLADKVVTDLVPRDWISPFERIADELMQSFKDHTAQADKVLNDHIANADKVLNDFQNKVTDLVNELNRQGSATTSMLNGIQNRIAELEDKIKRGDLFTKEEADAFKQGIQQELVRTSKHYQAVSEMVADGSLGKGTYAGTAGYYEAGDGGAASYIITDSEPSTHYEKLNNGLYAKLIITDHVTPEQYGAKGDGINDDTQAVQSALMSNNLVEFPAGKSYHTTSTITVTQVVNLNGNFSPIVYDGTGTAISFDAEGMPSHQRDMGAVNNLKIKAPNADIALNWNYAIKTVVRGLKIYNFKHIGINMQNAGYESKMDDVYLIGKAGQQTIGIAGAANDMTFGSLYGLNCQTYFQMKGGAVYIEYIHPWCGNVATEDNPALTDDEYKAWYRQTCIIDYCNPDNAANTTINYLYADNYYTIVAWNTRSTENLIKTLMMLAVSGPLLKLGEGASVTSTANLVIDDLYVPDYKYYVGNNYSLYPTIKKINGEKAMKVIEVDVNGTKVPITEGRITQYSFTATEDTPQYTNVKGIEDLPMACNNKDWGAVSAIRIGQKIDESVSYLTSPLPNETTNIFTLFLRPLPIRKGKSFKYVIDDLNWKG